MVSVAFVVDNPASLNAKETAIKSRLEGFGWTVTLYNDGDTPDSWTPTDYDLVLISQTVTSTNVTWICNDAVPIWTEEWGLVDDVQLGTGGGNTSPTTYTQVNIVDNTHYITLPYSTGLLTVCSASAFGYGTGWANDVDNLGEIPGDSTKSCLLEIDKNETGADGNPTPERRVYFGIAAFATTDVLNTAGWDLFDRSVKWLAYQVVVTKPSGSIVAHTMRTIGAI